MSFDNGIPLAQPPFGWYPDPAGSDLLRWWNGSAWTERLEQRRPEVQSAVGTWGLIAS